MKLAKVFVAALACTGLLFAQPAVKDPANAQVKSEKVTSTAGMKMVRTIVSVDAQSNTIVVKSRKTQETLPLWSGVKVVVGKKESAIRDLKPGTKVTITCKMVDGKKVVSRIVEKAVL
ncbi:MAG: hypothetical protein MUF22_03335 [Chitinispirillaceae bacterium]|jgi:hypothetical protein|nr:hypothetical protein [Chitinispirillaceae bacterium]